MISAFVSDVGSIATGGEITGSSTRGAMLRVAIRSVGNSVSNCGLMGVTKDSGVTKGSITDGRVSTGRFSGGGSTRSIDRVGGAALAVCVNAGGGAFCFGRLANCSWLARSKAAAPSPNTRSETVSSVAANRKRKPGSMDADSARAAGAQVEGRQERGENAKQRGERMWDRPDHESGIFRIPQPLVYVC